MTTRAARQNDLQGDLVFRIRGLKKDPCLSGFLDEFDRADGVGLNQLVEQFMASIRRERHFGGFNLELAVANICMDLPLPRNIRCEQQEGLCRSPGDIWVDKDAIRYEFQCKHTLNWTTELFVEDAIERIMRSTKADSPGYYFNLQPSVIGDLSEWRGFADWVVANYKTFQVGEPQEYSIRAQLLAIITLSQTRTENGLFTGTNSTEAMGVDMEKLQNKIKNGFVGGIRTLSAAPSPSQMNLLAIDIDHFMIDAEDVYEALYGYATSVKDPAPVEPTGLFHVHGQPMWSGVAFVKNRKCNPYVADMLIYPNPTWALEVKKAFASFPRCLVVETGEQVGA